MSEQAWYLVVRGQKVGPMSRAALIDRLRRPGHGPHTLVWTASMTDWAAAGGTELGPALAMPPPVSASPLPSQAPAAARITSAGPTGDDASADDGPVPERWVSFGKAVARFWRRAATLRGRASRSEFWWAIPTAFAIWLVVVAINAGPLGRGDGLVPCLVGLILLIPTLTIGVRRLHDTGRRGWWMLIGIVPKVGFTILVVLFCLSSTRRANRFGP